MQVGSSSCRRLSRLVDRNLAIPTGLSLIIDAYRVTITDTVAFPKHTHIHKERADPIVPHWLIRSVRWDDTTSKVVVVEHGSMGRSRVHHPRTYRSITA